MNRTPFAPLTRSDVEAIALELQPMVGARLQECAQLENEIGLAFYNRGALTWLWFDFDPGRPFIAQFHGSPPFKKKPAPKPLALFIRARLLSRRLVAVEAERRLGRVLIFHFFAGPSETKNSTCEFEARLFPRGQNAIARAEGKSVSMRPVQTLPEQPLAEQTAIDAARPWSEMQNEWHARRAPAPVLAAKTDAPAPRTREQKAWDRALEKKSRALVKMRADLAAKQDAPWAAVGEWLKAHGSLATPTGMSDVSADCIDLKKSFAWNIQNCFSKAKDSARKIAAARERIGIVERELAKLRMRGPATLDQRAAQTTKRPPSLLERAAARGRKLKVAEDLEAYVGKSAADNLALLRRAQPHDFWLHLRDHPGAHAILRRPKGRAVTDEQLRETGRWLVEQSFNKSSGELAGQRFDLIVVECRRVRPIKGDKLGRVNYSDERTLQVSF